MLELINLLNIEGCKSLMGGINIPDAIFKLTHYVILVIQIVVPILLIIWGMLDFAKGLIKGKDDEIKAGQKTFISRLIVAVMVFLVVTITRLVVSLVSNLNGSGNDKDIQTDGDGFTTCINAFLNGE